MSVLLSRNGRDLRAEVLPAGEGYLVTLDGRPHSVEGVFGPAMRVLVDGRPVEASVRREGSDLVVELGGRRHAFRLRDPRAPKLARRNSGADATRGEIHAPMPGLVVEVLVEMGDTVEAGQAVVVVEAMKMQNALTTPLAGRIGAIRIAAGQAVETGQLLIAVQPMEP